MSWSFIFVIMGMSPPTPRAIHKERKLGITHTLKKYSITYLAVEIYNTSISHVKRNVNISENIKCVHVLPMTSNFLFWLLSYFRAMINACIF